MKGVLFVGGMSIIAAGNIAAFMDYCCSGGIGYCLAVDAPLGFEPRLARSKRAVLPLDDRAMANPAAPAGFCGLAPQGSTMAPAAGVEPAGGGFGDRAAPTRSLIQH